MRRLATQLNASAQSPCVAAASLPSLSSGCLIAAIIVVLSAAIRELVPRATKEGLNVFTLEWELVWTNAVESGHLPTTPVLLRNSPMQQWWQANSQTFSIDAITALAATSPTGDYNVTWLSQREAPVAGLYDVDTFLNHNVERYEGYGFASGREGASPRHTRRARTLRHALRELWADVSATSSSSDAAASSSSGRASHYVTAFMDDFAPSLAQPLTEWLPAGCLRDDRFEAAAAWVSATCQHHRGSATGFHPARRCLAA